MTIFISTFFFFFFFTDTATTEIYTLSLHDALPIFFRCVVKQVHQTFTPGFSQHRIFCKLAFREIATREVIDRSFRDLDVKVLLDSKQEIEQVHRRETEIVEKELLRSDRFGLRECECLAY